MGLTVRLVMLAGALLATVATASLYSTARANWTSVPPAQPQPQPVASHAMAEQVSPASSFRPAKASQAVDSAIHKAVQTYNLLRWFYYAMVARESSFDPNAVGPFNEPGLVQLNGAWYAGEPYPMNLKQPNNADPKYARDMNFAKFGDWISMSQISKLSDPFDPTQNLDRFSSGYAVPTFYLFKRVYGLSDDETLRAVAFHWNKGVFKPYDPYNTDYLGLYDKYVTGYKPPVEAEDGVWNGQPTLPPAS